MPKARPTLVKPSSASSALRSGFSGKVGKIPSGTGLQSVIRDAMINGTGSYRDIDNAFSAGGHDGNGSVQSSVVNNGTVKTSVSKRKSSRKSSKKSVHSGGSSGDSSSPLFSSASQAFDYYEAPIAEKYGFSRETAYQEALANTAYRREMEDMRKAGLNPSVIYGSHNTSGADSSIYPTDTYTPVSYAGSGSGGSGRRSRGGNSGKYVFSGGAYYGIMAGVGAVTAIATGNVGAGMAAAGLAGTALKALNGFFKK